MQKETFGQIFAFAGQKRAGYIRSVIFAVIGAVFQILPFFVMARVTGKLLGGNRDLVGYLTDCVVMAVLWLLRDVSITVDCTVTYRNIRSPRQHPQSSATSASRDLKSSL